MACERIENVSGGGRVGPFSFGTNGCDDTFSLNGDLVAGTVTFGEDSFSAHVSANAKSWVASVGGEHTSQSNNFDVFIGRGYDSPDITAKAGAQLELDFGANNRNGETTPTGFSMALNLLAEAEVAILNHNKSGPVLQGQSSEFTLFEYNPIEGESFFSPNNFSTDLPSFSDFIGSMIGWADGGRGHSKSYTVDDGGTVTSQTNTLMGYEWIDGERTERIQSIIIDPNANGGRPQVVYTNVVEGTGIATIAQMGAAGYSTAKDATVASAQIVSNNARNAHHEPEAPVVPPTATNNNDNGPDHGRPDPTDDTAAVVVAPTAPDPTLSDPTAPTPGTAWVDPNTGRTNVQGDPVTGAGGHGTQAPVILDLDGDGVEVAFGEDIYFDLDDDGFLEQTSWASADDGFLVIDKLANDVRDTDGSDGWGDGVIDQSNELVLSSLGLEGDTDLQALARYDDNGDGKLDASDAIWNELKVWQDLNQDGKTEGDGTELKTLAAWGISSINIAYDDGTDFTDESNDVEVFGNILNGLAVAA